MMSKRRKAGEVPAPSLSPLRVARKCSLGCPLLDTFLQGGIPCGTITELVGESGSAKTQICLQLLVSAQMPLSDGGLGGRSVYIYTENYFPSRRLQQLAKGFLDTGKLGSSGLMSVHQKASSVQYARTEGTKEKQRAKLNLLLSGDPHNHVNTCNPLSNASACGHFGASNNLQDEKRNLTSFSHNFEHTHSLLDIHSSRLEQMQRYYMDDQTACEGCADPCDNIFVQSIQNVEELCAFLDQLYILLACPLAMPVKLIVIDSVAALFRSDFDNNAKDLAMRMEWFFKLSSKLKQYAHQYDIAVLVTNQVVDHVEQDNLKRQNCVDAMLSGSSKPLISAGRRVVPSLGIGWSHCVNTRLFLSRTYELNKQVQINHLSSENLPKSMYYKAEAELDGWRSQAGMSVLQQLESELPDDLLLTVSHQKYVSSCHAYNDKASPVERDTLGCALFEESSSNHNESYDFELHITSRVKRMLHVVFAPHLPMSSCEFVVEPTQVRGVSVCPPKFH